MSELNDANLNRLLGIGISLATQRNMPKLLDTILTQAMEITHCDAGTLYLCEEQMLSFKIMHNHTLQRYQGGENEPATLPPVAITEENVCAYVVIHRKLENIPDVYCSDKFDFSGPKNYDKITGYRTKSMMVIPLENNRGVVVGVLQLINALDSNHQIIAFDEKFELIFRSVAAQAAITVTNMQYTRDIKELFNSLAQVLAAAIDERSPYNASHTKNVVQLVTDFLEFINQKHLKGEAAYFFDENLCIQIIMAAWLHDIGKIFIPRKIMDKATRLGDRETLVMMRLDMVYLTEQVRFLKGEMTAQQWQICAQEVTDAKALCKRLNTGAPATAEELARIQSLGRRRVVMDNMDTQEALFWLDAQDVDNLSIRFGTLTQSERRIMEDHVNITRRLLGKIKFTHEYKDVPVFAIGHHERLNGNGYPDRLKANELPTATRVLAIMDVFEALTAKDRPYKPPISLEKAFDILDEMTASGELDKDLVNLLKEQQMMKRS